MTAADIYTALRTVTDPQTGKDVVERAMVQQLQVEDDKVRFTLRVPAKLDAAAKASLNFACQAAITQAHPQADVHVHMEAANPQAPAANNPLPQVKNIIAVASGKGGVGKSTVSVNLALALRAMGARVGLIDADLYGPSIPTMLGLQGKRPTVHNVNGQPKIEPLPAHGIHVMSIGFIIEPEQAVVLRGPRLGGIIRQFLAETTWPELDYLVIDLPPGTGDIQLTLVQTVPVTGSIIVTTPQEVAVVDAVKATNMFRLPNVGIPILGVVENMSWFTPAELPNNKYYLFGQGGGKKLTKLSESMLLGQVPLVQAVREGGDTGQPIMLQPGDNPAKAALRKVAENTVRQVALRHEALPPTDILRVQG